MSTYLEYIHPYTYTSIHFPWAYIVYKFLKYLPCLFFQNMGLKETQEFPSPEQFVRNNYGKFTHHTDLLIPNDQTVTNQSQSNKSHRASFQMIKQILIRRRGRRGERCRGDESVGECGRRFRSGRPMSSF